MTNYKDVRIQRDAALERAEVAEKKLADKEAEAKKRWNCTAYCENCKFIVSMLCPPGWEMKTGDCVNCRVRGMLHPVVNKPFGW